jgi:hypothetical protein
VVRPIVHLRLKQRLGPVQIADRVGVAPSTVHAVLTRCRLNRLSHLDRHTGEPVRRYEHDRSGATPDGEAPGTHPLPAYGPDRAPAARELTRPIPVDQLRWPHGPR